MWYLIENDVVIESTDIDPAGRFHPDLQWIKSDKSGLIGWSYIGGKFSKPIDHTPSVTTCTPAQGLVSLFALKQITEDDVQAAIDSIEDPVQKYTAQIAFKRAVTWERNSQTMQTMAQLLSLSEKDLDDLFEYAVTIQA